MTQLLDDELDLVRAAQSGDKSAFSRLYDAYFARIYDFGYQMVRNHEDAADLVSEVFLKAMERLGSLKDPAAFKGWLYAIARNAALNLIERRGRVTGLVEEIEPPAPPPGSGLTGVQASPDPAEAAEGAELRQLVWEAASTLNPRDYSIFEMTVRQGLDSAEVAEVLGVKTSHAYVLVNRLKGSIEEALSAVVMAKVGRRDCSTLDALVAEFSGEVSPRFRKALLRHMRACDDCAQGRKKYASAAALLQGVAMAEPAAGLKERVAERIGNAWDSLGPGSGDGPEPPRALRALVPAGLVGLVVLALVQQAAPDELSRRFHTGGDVPPVIVATPTPSPSPSPEPPAEPTPTPTPEPTPSPRPRRVTPKPPTPTPTRPPRIIIITPKPSTPKPTATPCRDPRQCPNEIG